MFLWQHPLLFFPPPSCLQVFQSKDVPEKTCSPEESIRMTKGITMATAKAVAAGNSCRQEDVIATANLSRKAVADMLAACKVNSSRASPDSALIYGDAGRTGSVTAGGQVCL